MLLTIVAAALKTCSALAGNILIELFFGRLPSLYVNCVLHAAIIAQRPAGKYSAGLGEGMGFPNCQTAKLLKWKCNSNAKFATNSGRLEFHLLLGGLAKPVTSHKADTAEARPFKRSSPTATSIATATADRLPANCLQWAFDLGLIKKTFCLSS